MFLKIARGSSAVAEFARSCISFTNYLQTPKKLIMDPVTSNQLNENNTISNPNQQSTGISFADSMDLVFVSLKKVLLSFLGSRVENVNAYLTKLSGQAYLVVCAHVSDSIVIIINLFPNHFFFYYDKDYYFVSSTILLSITGCKNEFMFYNEIFIIIPTIILTFIHFFRNIPSIMKISRMILVAYSLFLSIIGKN